MTMPRHIQLLHMQFAHDPERLAEVLRRERALEQKQSRAATCRPAKETAMSSQHDHDKTDIIKQMVLTFAAIVASLFIAILIHHAFSDDQPPQPITQTEAQQ